MNPDTFSALWSLMPREERDFPLKTKSSGASNTVPRARTYNKKSGIHKPKNRLPIKFVASTKLPGNTMSDSELSSLSSLSSIATEESTSETQKTAEESTPASQITAENGWIEIIESPSGQYDYDDDPLGLYGGPEVDDRPSWIEFYHQDARTTRNFARMAPTEAERDARIRARIAEVTRTSYNPFPSNAAQSSHYPPPGQWFSTRQRNLPQRTLPPLKICNPDEPIASIEDQYEQPPQNHVNPASLIRRQANVRRINNKKRQNFAEKEKVSGSKIYDWGKAFSGRDEQAELQEAIELSLAVTTPNKFEDAASDDTEESLEFGNPMDFPTMGFQEIHHGVQAGYENTGLNAPISIITEDQLEKTMEQVSDDHIPTYPRESPKRKRDEDD